MRGSRCHQFGRRLLRGIIPAHAGLTARTWDSDRCRRDHPRACGAHISSRYSVSDFLGSSPRMRGSLSLPWALLMRLGIIPAHAGLTRGSAPARACAQDHPRACGAHGAASASRDASRGSSPRMRGSHQPFLISIDRFWIIPAHAGLTTRIVVSRNPHRDHPRACGAHVGNLAEYLDEAGSSPRMRGSQLYFLCRLDQLGIIPAHAGLTQDHQCSLPTSGDHPRACGAHTKKSQY